MSFSPMAQAQQQRVQQQHQMQLPKLTTVNGIGMWNQWTRNFKEPVRALLDLMDNAFDAAAAVNAGSHAAAVGTRRTDTTTQYSNTREADSSDDEDLLGPQNDEFAGYVHVYPDVLVDEDYHKNSNSPNATTITGLVIQNNSPHHIKPMAQVLQVYQSSKGNASSSIGENGVGLKQGCANLTDLSFCLSKNLNHYSLGVIARSLQRTEGCVLPSYDFLTLPSREDLEETMDGPQHEAVLKCIAEYGNGSLEDGMDRLCQHFADMIRIKHHQHVFCVVLHHLKHTGNDHDSDNEDSDDPAADSENGRAAARNNSNTTLAHRQERQHQQEQLQRFAQNALGLLRKLKEKLPRQYIHVSSAVKVLVHGELMTFAYWQRRLIELTSFQVKIDPKRRIIHKQKKSSSAAAPMAAVVPSSSAALSSASVAKDNDDNQYWMNPTEGYKFNVYCGFDPVRVHEDKRTPCSLLIYSRQSGRLISHHEDARSLLGLVSSGTDYSQGLTVLVDDLYGNLPLDPTKQDLAFGEETHGETHRANLFHWLSAVSKLYYKKHLKKFDGKKGSLTAEVERHYPTIQALQEAASTESRGSAARGTSVVIGGGSITVPTKPLPELTLSTIQNVRWYIKNERIVYRNLASTQCVAGEDTVITIQAPPVPVSPSAKTKTKSAKKSPRPSPASARRIDEDFEGDERLNASSSKKRPADRDSEGEGPASSKRRLLNENDVVLLQEQDLEIAGLKSLNGKLKQARIEWMNTHREAMSKIRTLELENASLKRELRAATTPNNRKHGEDTAGGSWNSQQQQQQQQQQRPRRTRMTASKSVGGRDPTTMVLQGRLTAAKSKIHELQQALKAAEERAALAEHEMAIQEEIAVDLRKESPELRREAAVATALESAMEETVSL